MTIPLFGHVQFSGHVVFSLSTRWGTIKLVSNAGRQRFGTTVSTPPDRVRLNSRFGGVQAKTLDPYDCKRFIVNQKVDNLLKAVSEKAQYMYDTALANYKNFQAAAKNLCDLAGIRDIPWPAPPLSPTDIDNIADAFPDTNIRGAAKSPPK